MNRTLICLGNTRAMLHCWWKRPDPSLDSAEPPGRSQVGCRVGLVWQTGKQGHSSLRPPQVFTKVRSRRTHPLACATNVRKNEGLEAYHQHRGNNFGGKWDRREFLNNRWLVMVSSPPDASITPWFLRVFTHLKGTLV